MKRITIELPDNIAEKLEELAQTNEVTQNQIIRRSICTEYLIDAEVKSGCRISSTSPAGSVKEFVFR